MPYSHELNRYFPTEIIHAVPTFAMPERNSCVPTVLRSVLGHFEPSLSVSADDLDTALGRKSEEPATTESFCQFLALRDYHISIKQLWDDEQFVKDNYGYVKDFYKIESDRPRVPIAAFNNYYTEETLSKLHIEASDRLAELSLHPLEKIEAGLPTHNDIRRFVAGGNLVAVTLVGSEDAGTHFGLVCGYTDNQDEITYHVFNPNFTNAEVTPFKRASFDEEWMPEEGIIAIRRA